MHNTTSIQRNTQCIEVIFPFFGGPPEVTQTHTEKWILSIMAATMINVYLQPTYVFLGQI